MGQTLQPLSNRPLSSKPIFPHRFVVELCEQFHIHYKNLRIVLSTTDFINLAEGMSKSLDRWKKLGSQEPSHGTHVELTRKEVGQGVADNSILINLNRNLYPLHEGRIFAEGADFRDEQYVHVKVRDLRLELSLSDFKELSAAVKEAEERLHAFAQ